MTIGAAAAARALAAASDGRLSIAVPAWVLKSFAVVSSAKNWALRSVTDCAGARLALVVEVDVDGGAVIADGELHAARANPSRRIPKTRLACPFTQQMVPRGFPATQLSPKHDVTAGPKCLMMRPLLVHESLPGACVS